jgi:hypothetical protein
MIHPAQQVIRVTNYLVAGLPFYMRNEANPAAISLQRRIV